MLSRETISGFFINLQDRICKSLQEEDGKAAFQEDLWERPGGGGGRSRVIQDGNVFEKGGVNFSAVFGEIPSFLKKEMNIADAGEFYATGISIVIHPASPMVPIIHMNTRYFEAGEKHWWFGGGIDLTPIYVVEEDARNFHKELKQVCDKHNKNYYPQYKKWADDYFYLPHRNETRGIGGIFFDKLNAEDEIEKEKIFSFVKDLGEAFIPLYLPLVKKYRDTPFDDNHKKWQLLRRGRYVEFNLLYDKGTKFGLETNGRVESILMSLPKFASWVYNFQPSVNSLEHSTLSFLKKKINW